MRWRDSKFRRWISWLKSLLKVGEGSENEFGGSPLGDVETWPSISSTPKRRVEKRPYLEFKQSRRAPWIDGFRGQPKGGILLRTQSPLRPSVLKRTGVLNGAASLARSQSVSALTTRRASPKPSLQAEAPGFHPSPAGQATRPEKRRTLLLEELRSITERTQRGEPGSVNSALKKQETATFSPPLETPLAARPRETRAAQKPCREPPLWLSLGPHLARQFRK